MYVKNSINYKIINKVKKRKYKNVENNKSYA